MQSAASHATARSAPLGDQRAAARSALGQCITHPDVLLSVLTRRDIEPSGPDQATVVALRDALSALPLEQSRPIVQMAFQGLTAKEISERHDVPLGTVKTRVRRGLRRLADELGVRDG